MAYQRKTIDEYEIQGNYSYHGFEVVTTEATYREAKIQVKCYRENEPYEFKIVKKRIKIETLNKDITK